MCVSEQEILHSLQLLKILACHWECILEPGVIKWGAGAKREIATPWKGELRD